MPKITPHFCNDCGHILRILEVGSDDNAIEDGFNYVCTFCKRLYEQADISSIIDAYRKDNDRLRERNSNLSSAVGISRAQNNIMREALEWILGVTEYHDRNDWGNLDQIDRKARQTLERIDEAMASVKCKHQNVKVDRQTDTYICRDCNLPLDEATKAKVKDVVENGGIGG